MKVEASNQGNKIVELLFGVIRNRWDLKCKGVSSEGIQAEIDINNASSVTTYTDFAESIVERPGCDLIEFPGASVVKKVVAGA